MKATEDAKIKKEEEAAAAAKEAAEKDGDAPPSQPGSPTGNGGKGKGRNTLKKCKSKSMNFIAEIKHCFLIASCYSFK